MKRLALTFAACLLVVTAGSYALADNLAGAMIADCVGDHFCRFIDSL